MSLKNIIETEYKPEIFSSEKIRTIKKDARTAFDVLDFPGKKNEEWRFTNITPIVKGDFYVADKPERIQLDNIPEYNLDGIIFVFINGIYSKEHSKISDLQEGFANTFSEGLKNHRSIIEEYFGVLAPYNTDGFSAMNTALFKEGIFLYAKANSEISKPVYIIYINDDEKEIVSNNRNLIVMDKNSKAEINEIYYSFSKGASFSNVITEIFLDENSELHYNKIQNENDTAYHIGTTQIEQRNSSRLYSYTISWGGSLIRNNLNTVLNGENVDCYYRGLYIINGNEIIDNHTLADHCKPNSHSNEHYKGIIDGKGQGVFNGKIMVRQDAQKTNAYQTNNNILLSNDVTINSKPQLEIYADDVKCSHGATTGQINPDEVFYLQSRGIDKNTAIKMLLSAYAHEIIDGIKNESLKEIVIKRLDEKLS